MRRQRISRPKRRWMRPSPRWPRRKQHAGAAHADNERVQALQNYTNVTAPLDGVVIWRYADTGALIQGGTNSNESGPSHRSPFAEQSASPPHSCPGRRCEICSCRRHSAGARGCHWPLFHRQDCALHARCELRNSNHGDRSRCGEQGSLHRSRHVRQHNASTWRMRAMW